MAFLFIVNRLGLVCNHVGSLFHVAMNAAKFQEKRTCTEDKCSWAGKYSKPVSRIEPIKNSMDK